VSVQTIRLDRFELKIPEFKERLIVWPKPRFTAQDAFWRGNWWGKWLTWK
jgi:hypothetical protein